MRRMQELLRTLWQNYFRTAFIVVRNRPENDHSGDGDDIKTQSPWQDVPLASCRCRRVRHGRDPGSPLRQPDSEGQSRCLVRGECGYETSEEGAGFNVTTDTGN